MPPTQEQVLHHRRGLTEPHPHRKRVVEILFSASHATQIQGRIAADLIGAAAGVGTDDQRHAGNDLETVEGLANPVPAGPQPVQLLRCELRSVEDG
jgi:hypothetical protein